VAVCRVVEHLLRHGAEPMRRDHGGYTATHYAALNGHRMSLELVCASHMCRLMFALCTAFILWC